MADRVTHTCPSCGEIAVFFYDECYPSRCEGCGKWWVVKKRLFEVEAPSAKEKSIWAENPEVRI